jgi:cell division ATPase FtsA
VKETVFTGIAEGRSVLDEEEKEEGVMLLDMGYSLTEMTVFFQGALAELAIIPSGWSDIKKDPKDEGRFDAIVSKVKAKVKELASRGGIKSIVLTGGVALLDDTVERIEEELSPSAPVKMGVAKAVKGNISSAESMQFATAIGLVKYGYEKYRKKAIERRNLVRNLSEKVLDIFNNYF